MQAACVNNTVLDEWSTSFYVPREDSLCGWKNIQTLTGNIDRQYIERPGKNIHLSIILVNLTQAINC